MTKSESEARREVVDCAHAISLRRLSHGKSGNVSVRWGEHIIVTGTGASLSQVTADDLTVIDMAGAHVDGPPASKEGFLHAAMLRARPHANGVVHTHSTHAAAVSCLAGSDPESAIPPLTAYFKMKVQSLPLLPFFAPGDIRLGAAAESAARDHAALLLRNHGPIAAGTSAEDALDIIEEIEETARIFLLLGNRAPNPVPAIDTWFGGTQFESVNDAEEMVQDE